jgi:hypothetical protein
MVVDRCSAGIQDIHVSGELPQRPCRRMVRMSSTFAVSVPRRREFGLVRAVSVAGASAFQVNRLKRCTDLRFPSIPTNENTTSELSSNPQVNGLSVSRKARWCRNVKPE